MIGGDLFIILGVLMVLLLILVAVYVISDSKPSRPKATTVASESPKPEATPPTRKPPKERPTFDAVEAIILDRSSSAAALEEAVEMISRYYTQVHATTLQRYIRIIVTLCRHPQTSKEMIVALDRALQNANPNWRPEIDAALKKGLESRM